MAISRYPTWRRLALLMGLTSALLAASSVVADGQAEKKKQGNSQSAQTQTAQAETARAELQQTLSKVDRDLLAYATATARSELGELAEEDHAGSLIVLGRIYEQEKKYAKAKDCFERAGELAPRNPLPWAFLGEAYLHQKRQEAATSAFGEARTRAEAIVAKNPDHATAHYFLGVARQRLEQYGLARQSLRRARELDPQNPMPVYQLGVTEALQQKWQGAVDLLTEALELNQNIAYAYYYRGLSAGQIGRKDMMIADLERFLELAPEAPEAPIAARTVASARR